MKHARRSEARARWARVANGDAGDAEHQRWLRETAAAILEADNLPDPDGKERPARVMRAAGLAGRKGGTGPDYQTIRALEMLTGPEGGEVGAHAIRVLAMIATGDQDWLKPGVKDTPKDEVRTALLLAGMRPANAS